MTSLNQLWRSFLIDKTGLNSDTSTADLEKKFWNDVAETDDLPIDDAKEIALEGDFPIATYGSRHDQELAFWRSHAGMGGKGYVDAKRESLKNDLVILGD